MTNIMKGGLSTTGMPDYLFEFDIDSLSKHRDFDRVWVYDVEVVSDRQGMPDLESTDCIGGFVGDFHHYSGDIDARVQEAMSLTQIAAIFHDLPHTVHLSGSALPWCLTQLGDNRQVTEHSQIFTIQITAAFSDGYELLHEVIRRLIHHDIWKSAKNVTPAGGVF